MDKNKIIEAYQDLTKEINSLSGGIKSHLTEVGKFYSIFINSLHDLDTSIILKKEETKTLDREIDDLKKSIEKRKETLAKLIKNGEDTVNKQREDFEQIKTSEIERLSVLNKQSEIKLQEAEKLTSSLKQKIAESEEKKSIVDRYDSQLSERELVLIEREAQVIKKDEDLKSQSMVLQNREILIDSELIKVKEYRKDITDGESSTKINLEKIKTANAINETILNNIRQEKNNVLWLKKDIERKEDSLKEEQEKLNILDKQLKDKEKNLNAYKEEIDYNMALLKEEIETKKRKLVLNKK